MPFDSIGVWLTGRLKYSKPSIGFMIWQTWHAVSLCGRPRVEILDFWCIHNLLNLWNFAMKKIINLIVLQLCLVDPNPTTCCPRCIDLGTHQVWGIQGCRALHNIVSTIHVMVSGLISWKSYIHRHNILTVEHAGLEIYARPRLVRIWKSRIAFVSMQTSPLIYNCLLVCLTL